jgi:alpha-ketoglutarate-dependent taurine dioxygenase
MTAPSLSIRPIPGPLGAEILDVDLTRVDDSLFAAIRQAWLDHLVLMIRGQTLSDNQQMEFSRRFGELDEVPIVGVGQKPRDNKYISVVSNVVENGVAVGGLGDDEVFWHSDTSYRERPPSASVLYCLKVPNWGGNTGFSNMYLALETLAPEMRRRVDGLTVKNDTTYNAGGQLRAGFEPITDLRKSPGAIHPMVRTHPETGRNALNLGRRRNAYIPSLEIEESEQLLDQLWAHATQDFLSWHHKWQIGDVVIWDNRCTMHRRDNFDPHSHRIMHRAQAQELTRPYHEKDKVAPPHPRGQTWLASDAPRVAART